MSEENLPVNKEAAAQLIASGGVEKQEIAKRVGVSRATLWNWENKDEKFKARIESLKQEFEIFGIQLISSKFNDAIKDLWNLGQDTKNDKVRYDVLRYFIDQKIGKPTSKAEITYSGDEDKDRVSINEMEEELKGLIIGTQSGERIEVNDNDNNDNNDNNDGDNDQ